MMQSYNIPPNVKAKKITYASLRYIFVTVYSFVPADLKNVNFSNSLQHVDP